MEFIANYHDYGLWLGKSVMLYGERDVVSRITYQRKQTANGAVRRLLQQMGIVLQAPSWASLFTPYSSYSSLTSSPPASLPSFSSPRNPSYHRLTRRLRSLKTASSHQTQIYHPSFVVCSVFRWLMHGYLDEVWMLCRLWRRLQEQRQRDPLR